MCADVLYLAIQDANAIHKLIPGAVFDDGWLVPCNVNASLALTLGGQAFSIDTRDLKFLPVDPDHPTGNCTSGITPGTVGPDFQWLVRPPFLTLANRKLTCCPRRALR